MSLKDPFQLIRNSDEKTQILTDIADSKREILAKAVDPSTAVFPIVPKSLFEEQLTCTISPTVLKTLQGQDLILQLFTAEDKYLAQFTFEIHEPYVVLDTTGDLYKLQRREDYRLRLPRSFTAKLEGFKRSGSAPLPSPVIVDISAGGCRLELNNEIYSLKEGDNVTSELSLADRPTIHITALVKYVRPNTENTKLSYVGLQFTNLPELARNRLAALVLDLYRELFAVFKNKRS